MRRKIHPLLALSAVLLLFLASLVLFPRVIIAFFLAFFLAFLLEPLVQWFQKSAADWPPKITFFLIIYFWCHFGDKLLSRLG